MCKLLIFIIFTSLNKLLFILSGILTVWINTIVKVNYKNKKMSKPDYYSIIYKFQLTLTSSIL